MALRLGIDVGGTNTDAVLVREHEVIACAKTRTTSDVLSGIRTAVQAVLQTSGSGSGQDQYDSCFPACATHNILAVADMTQGAAMVGNVAQRVPHSCRTYHCGSVHAWHYAFCQCMCAKTKSCQNSSAQAVWLSHTRIASFLRHASRYCLRSQGSKLSIEW